MILKTKGMSDSWLNSKKTTDPSNGNKEIKADNLTKLVSSVIHEYDVIEDPPLSQPQAQTQAHGSVKMTDMIQSKVDNVEKLLEDDKMKPAETVTDQALVYPRVNCKEKIVICVDLSSEMDKVTFRSRAGDKWTPLKLVKRALGFFLHSKTRINKSHEYALVILLNNARWVRDFSSNPKDILSFFDDQVLLETTSCETFDASSLFDTLLTRLELPPVEGDVSIVPPQYIIRVLLIYGRSHCPIEFHNKESFKQLDSSPYFFVDVMYVHEAPSEENKCEVIFDSLCDFDEKGMSYVFEAARNPTRFYDQMSQLLAHPLQRPLQRDIACRLHNVAELVENSQTTAP